MAKENWVPDPFDPFCRKLIREQARRVVRGARLRDHDIEDVEQDLRMHTWQRAVRFDADRGTWSTFARAVIERKAATLLQHHRATRRARTQEAHSLDEVDPDTDRRRVDDLPDDRGRAVGSRRAAVNREAAIDVRAAIRRLAPRDRVLASALMVGRVAEVSAATGVPRATLYERIARIREQFRDEGLAPESPTRPTVSRPAQ
jgi:RNA polymerase sigma factor (sigma-70 family)